TSGCSRHSLRRTTVYSTSGSPCAENTAFIVALSMPTADASTPAPTYGTSASSSSPWMVPSSPYGPCSMMTTTSRPARSSAGIPPAGSTRTSALEASAVSALSARSARAFLTAPVASPLGRPTRACVASARRGSPPTTQRPSRPIPMGTTTWPRCSSAEITEAADARETSCSPERPPKITPTRSGAMPRILAGEDRQPLAACAGPGGDLLDESVCHESVVFLRDAEQLHLVPRPDGVARPRAEPADVDVHRFARAGFDDEFPRTYGRHPAADLPHLLGWGLWYDGLGRWRRGDRRHGRGAWRHGLLRQRRGGRG